MSSRPMRAAAMSSSMMMSAQQLSVMYVAFFIINSIVIWLANRWYPNAVVLGTHIHSPLMGLVYSMVVFTLLVVGAVPVIEYVTAQMKWRLSNRDWMMLYFVVNLVALWVVARFAEQLGMGLSSWVVVAVLSVIINLAQGMAVKFVVMKV